MNIAFEDIRLFLLSNSSDAERKFVLNEHVLNNTDINDLIPLLFEPHPINMRFAWFLGDMATHKPEFLRGHLTYLFQHRNSFNILNFNRSLAKFFLHCGIPNEIEAEVLDELFVWLNSKKDDISTKSLTLKVLMKLVKKYPELKPELISSLERILVYNAHNSLGKLAIIAIQKLNHFEANGGFFKQAPF